MVRDETYRVLQLVDHDKQFSLNEMQGVNPVLLNKFPMTDPATMGLLKELIFSDGSDGDFVAKCQCNHLEGNNKIGMTCPICGTDVSPIELLDHNNLICKNWLSAPDELPHGWLAPKIFLALSNWLSYDKGRKNKRNYLDDILNVDSNLPYDVQDVITGRGFTYLYENFDRLIEYFAYQHPIISRKPDTPAMVTCLKLYRNQLFCHYIPILNSAINPIISTDGVGPNKRQYSDTTADFAISAAITLSQLEFSPKKKNRLRTVEQTAYKAYRNIISYVEDATSKYLSIKKAIPRMHIFGTRFHWSFRAVVVPIIGPHRYDELHVPYQMAVNTLRVQILGILCRDHQLPINIAVAKVRRALMVIDEDVLAIINKMIADSPFPGLPCVWDRPPSIRDGSVMLKYWTVIKTDLEDGCISMTPTDVALPNADFDGDNLAGILIFETEMVKALRAMSPAHLIYDRNNGGISSDIGIHKTTSVTINSFLQLV